MCRRSNSLRSRKAWRGWCELGLSLWGIETREQCAKRLYELVEICLLAQRRIRWRGLARNGGTRRGLPERNIGGWRELGQRRKNRREKEEREELEMARMAVLALRNELRAVLDRVWEEKMHRMSEVEKRFYLPAVRNAWMRCPPLEKPQMWSGCLDDVEEELRHYLWKLRSGG